MAVFTGQLVIGNSRQERMARTHERAYVIFGGLYGKPIDAEWCAKSKQAGDGAWRDASIYSEPWIMQIHNFGRTPGFITKITWGVCDKDKFIKDKSVSEIIEYKLLPIEPPVETEVVVNLTTVDNPTPYRHVQPGRFARQVFFGRIDYRDVFKVCHHSTWAVEHTPQASDAIGNFMATDWS